MNCNFLIVNLQGSLLNWWDLVLCCALLTYFFSHSRSCLHRWKSKFCEKPWWERPHQFWKEENSVQHNIWLATISASKLQFATSSPDWKSAEDWATATAKIRWEGTLETFTRKRTKGLWQDSTGFVITPAFVKTKHCNLWSICTTDFNWRIM